LIVRINKIYITGGREHSIVELGVSFIVREGDDYYELLHTGTVNVFGWVSFLTNSSRKYGKSVLEAFKVYFADLSRRKYNNTLIKRQIIKDELWQLPDPDSGSYQNFNQPTPVKGVFYGFSDFVDHVVDTLPEFDVDLQMDSENIRVNVKFQENISQDVWGICDGQNYFFNFGNTFYPLIIHQNTINTYIESINLGSNANVGGAIGGLGGMVGSLIGYAIVAAIDIATSSIVGLEFDLLTGDIIQGKNDQATIFDCHSGRGKEEICIYYETEKLACLKRGEYFRFNYNAPVGIEKFILQTHSTSRVVYLNPQNNHRIVILNKGDRIVFRHGARWRPNNLRNYLEDREEVRP